MSQIYVLDDVNINLLVSFTKHDLACYITF